MMLLGRLKRAVLSGSTTCETCSCPAALMSMVAVGYRQAEPMYQQIGHVAGRQVGGLVERLCRGDGGHHLGRLDHRVHELQVAAHVDPQGDAPRDLDAGAADLAVAHHGVQIAGGQQSAGRGHRQVHHRALPDEPRVHVATVRARRAARHRRARRGDPDDADHRPHRAPRNHRGAARARRRWARSRRPSRVSARTGRRTPGSPPSRP